MDYSQLHNHQLAFDADTQTAHPCSQPQDQLGSLFETHEVRNSLYHHGHKLLHFPILLNVFLPYDLPDVRIRQLQRRCHKAKGGQGKGTWKRVWKHYVAQCGSYCAVMRPIFKKKKKSSPASTPTNLAQIRPVSVIANWRVLVIEKLQTLCHLWGCAIAACRGHCSASGRLLKAAEKPQRVWKSARLRVRVQ